METRGGFTGVRAGITLAIGILATVSAGQPVSVGEKIKMNGVITSRDGANMTVNSSDRGNVVVVLTDNSEVSASRGGLGLLRKGVAVTALIPGLKVSVEGVGDEKGRVIATKVHFTEGDLKTAQAIQAGLSPTASKLQATDKQVQANQQGIQQVKSDEANLAQRFGELGEYDTKGEATVYFAVGSTTISADGQRDLGKVAATAKGLPNYLIEVEGFADSSGNAATNEKLSEERSQAVVNWLAQSGGISFLHMLAPGAMGTSDPAASNETAQGRSENRRVVVKVVVNRGLAQP
jgi:outer membrane protein OmpA-like peptidoglycan-associated protein